MYTQALQSGQRVLAASVSAQQLLVRSMAKVAQPRKSNPPHKRGKTMWIASSTIKYINHTGLKAMKNVLPAVLKITQERKPHLFRQDTHTAQAVISSSSAEKATLEPANKEQASDPLPADGGSVNLSVKESIQQEVASDDGSVTIRESGPNQMAKVPDFARFAEFRESHLDFDPTKLHVVWRVKAMSGRPRYEKNIMRELKLDRPIGVMSLVKNTPDINAKLWMVKHLIYMKPFTIPDAKSIPTDEHYKGMLLKRNGQFVPSKYYRDNYFRAVNRPELEKYVLLTSEKEGMIRNMWFHGSKDGSLLNHLPCDGTVNPTREGGELKKNFIPGSDKWDQEKRWKAARRNSPYEKGGDLSYHKIGS